MPGFPKRDIERCFKWFGFRVYRKEGSGSYGLWQTLGANVVQVQDSGVIMYETYRYYIVAYNAVGESAQSNEAVVTVMPA